MTRGVLWDSSAILALLDADDSDHAQAATAARQIASEGRPSFITNYIEAEAHALLLRKLGRLIARELLTRYSDKDWTLCDAISFAVLEDRRVARVFTFDRHFRQYDRFQVLGLRSR